MMYYITLTICVGLVAIAAAIIFGIVAFLETRSSVIPPERRQVE